jgi:hypothetical protein
MDTDGFVVALVIGVVVLLMPLLWLAWWLIADLGERVNGAYATTHYEKTRAGLRPAA